MKQIMNRSTRKYLYGVTLALMLALSAADVIEPELVPYWLNVAAAILGIGSTATALGHLTPKDTDDGV